MARRAEGTETGPRLGIFGGTFDPPHNGHRIVATDVADRLALDLVLWIPAGQPPHKLDAPLTPAPLRLEMVRAAAATDPRFQVSDLELRRPGPSYTVDTLTALRQEHPGAALFLIMGVDQYRALAGWSRPEEILRLATLVVMSREGDVPGDAVPGVVGAGDAVFAPVTRVDVSSTAVRRAVAAGEPIEGLVAPAVRAIIEQEGLYRR